MSEKYYVAGCVDNGLDVDQVEDQDAEFWTLYARDVNGESEALADFTDRRSAEAAMAVYIAHDVLSGQVRALAAEAAIQDFIISAVRDLARESDGVAGWHRNGYVASWDEILPELAHSETPATDAILNEVRAQARKEGAFFVANRMLAAWEAGFVEDTAENAADIARMILTAADCMAEAPEGDFDRSFADEVLQGIAARIRAGEVPDV